MLKNRLYTEGVSKANCRGDLKSPRQYYLENANQQCSFIHIQEFQHHQGRYNLSIAIYQHNASQVKYLLF